MTDYIKTLESKKSQYKFFLQEIGRKININYDVNLPRVTQLYGEKIEIAKKSLDILNKYKEKFFNIRTSDIEAMFAEDGDREKAGAQSYKKHMRPSMMKEFENSYSRLSELLNIDVFFGICQLPTIHKNGSVKYIGEKKKKK